MNRIKSGFAWQDRCTVRIARRLACASIAAFVCLAAPLARAQVTAEESAQGWISLFDGETLFGWQQTSDADWQVVDGEIRVGSGKPGFLCTNNYFADFELSAQFRVTAATNSGIFLRTTTTPKNPAEDCYELNIASAEVSPFYTGSFVARKKGEFMAPVDEAWHQFDVRAEGDRFQVSIDGRPTLDYTDRRPLLRGQIALQYNVGQVAFRAIKARPLGLHPLLNGRDLAGWREFPGKRSRFSVTPEGWLRIDNGDGQLESEAQFADFWLRIDVNVQGRGLNSGVFFRCLPGEFWQGYEAQIQNAFRRGDRTQPADFGTGGFYRRQPARRIVASDNEWFTMVVTAAGDHMAAWVNGYQVSDWTDDRAEADNPRQGLRRAAGTLALQGHDSTTKLLFRQIEAAEMPPRERSPLSP